MHEEAYLRSPSDVLDFVIVTSALFSLVMKDVDARGELVPRLWIMPLFNFDSVPRAISTLMVVTMMDGWETIMFQAMDRAGEDKQPVKNNQSWSAAYFLLFVFFSGMVWFNIFVGVVVNTYTTMQASDDGMTLVTKGQKQLEMSLKMQTWKSSMEWLNDVPESMTPP
eukprot:gene7992-9502_t